MIKVDNAKASGGSGFDKDAIHVNRTSEIEGIAVKPAPTGDDLLVIENAVNGIFEKKKILISSLPSGGGGQDNIGQNIGNSGFGLYAGKSGIALDFKNLALSSSMMVIVDDIDGNNLRFDIVPSEISIDAISDGTTYRKYTEVERIKLDSIEFGADITDVDNVTAALNEIPVSAHIDIISPGAYIEDAVTKKHIQGTDVTQGIQVQDIDMGGFGIINALNPINEQDLATKAYVDTHGDDIRAIHWDGYDEINKAPLLLTPLEGDEILLIESKGPDGDPDPWKKNKFLIAELPKGGPGSDTTAIHWNLPQEIKIVKNKSFLEDEDVFLIESSSLDPDNEHSILFEKRNVTGALMKQPRPNADTTAFHYNTDSEYEALLLKETPDDDDIISIEDSSDGIFTKKRITVKSLPGGGGANSDTTAIHVNRENEFEVLEEEATGGLEDYILVEAFTDGQLETSTDGQYQLRPKRKVRLRNLPSPDGGTAIHWDGVKEYIHAEYTETPNVDSYVLLETSDLSHKKEYVRIGNLPTASGQITGAANIPANPIDPTDIKYQAGVFHTRTGNILEFSRLASFSYAIKLQKWPDEYGSFIAIGFHPEAVHIGSFEQNEFNRLVTDEQIEKWDGYNGDIIGIGIVAGGAMVLAVYNTLTLVAHDARITGNGVAIGNNGRLIGINTYNIGQNLNKINTNIGKIARNTTDITWLRNKIYDLDYKMIRLPKQVVSWNFGGHRITNVKNAQDGHDVINKNTLDAKEREIYHFLQQYIYTGYTETFAEGEHIYIGKHFRDGHYTLSFRSLHAGYNITLNHAHDNYAVTINSFSAFVNLEEDENIFQIVKGVTFDGKLEMRGLYAEEGITLSYDDENETVIGITIKEPINIGDGFRFYAGFNDDGYPQLRTLDAGENIQFHVVDDKTIVISAEVVDPGTPHLANIGNGIEIFKGEANNHSEIRTLSGDTYIAVNLDGDDKIGITMPLPIRVKNYPVPPDIEHTQPIVEFYNNPNHTYYLRRLGLNYMTNEDIWPKYLLSLSAELDFLGNPINMFQGCGYTKSAHFDEYTQYELPVTFVTANNESGIVVSHLCAANDTQNDALVPRILIDHDLNGNIVLKPTLPAITQLGDGDLFFTMESPIAYIRYEPPADPEDITQGGFIDIGVRSIEARTGLGIELNELSGGISLYIRYKNDNAPPFNWGYNEGVNIARISSPNNIADPNALIFADIKCKKPEQMENWLHFRGVSNYTLVDFPGVHFPTALTLSTRKDYHSTVRYKDSFVQVLETAATYNSALGRIDFNVRALMTPRNHRDGMLLIAKNFKTQLRPNVIVTRSAGFIKLVKSTKKYTYKGTGPYDCFYDIKGDLEDLDEDVIIVMRKIIIKNPTPDTILALNLTSADYEDDGIEISLDPLQIRRLGPQAVALNMNHNRINDLGAGEVGSDAARMDQILSNPMTTTLEMNGYQIKNIAEAQESTDVPTLGQVESFGSNLPPQNSDWWFCEEGTTPQFNIKNISSAQENNDVPSWGQVKISMNHLPPQDVDWQLAEVPSNPLYYKRIMGLRSGTESNDAVNYEQFQEGISALPSQNSDWWFGEEGTTSQVRIKNVRWADDPFDVPNWGQVGSTVSHLPPQETDWQIGEDPIVGGEKKIMGLKNGTDEYDAVNYGQLISAVKEMKLEIQRLEDRIEYLEF